MSKLDEIQELREYLKRAENACDILRDRYKQEKSLIGIIKIIGINRIMKKLKNNIEIEINKIRYS